MKETAKSVSVKQVQLNDAFWSDFQNRIIDVVIPFQEKVLNDEIPDVEKSHAIENFRIAAGLSEGEFYGMVFQDSDVAKWLEGVAYSLTVKPDAELEARADDIIDIIEKAQQPDGYLNTFFTIKEPEHRWQNLEECHELYCAGHMMEAAVAYYQATGKDKLLHVMERMADHIIDRFGEDKERGIPGHQEVEIGLMRLYHVTGKEKYKDMARFFIDERGKNPEYFWEEKQKRRWSHWGKYDENKKPYTPYNQCHQTVYEQKEAVGHSVRAVYMYTAMADLAATEQDERLFDACQTLWDNMVEKRMYVTGGIGSTAGGEAFTIDYDLPNDMAYAETCASIGMAFFAKQMLRMKADGSYADILEREIYNGIISGIQLDGKKFFYVNPLEVNPDVSGKIHGHQHVLPTRPGWYGCACCPPNLVRLITSLGTYAWSESEDTIYSHLFMGQKAELGKAIINVDSKYPWEGQVNYHVAAKTSEEFTLAIHIPGYLKVAEAAECGTLSGSSCEMKPEMSSDTQGAERCTMQHAENCGIQDGRKGTDCRSIKVTLNGEAIDVLAKLKDGYLYITRRWSTNDEIAITFDMPVRRIFANTNVRADEGCVAFMRGPVVYCFEGVDNGVCLQALRIPKDLATENVQVVECKEGVLAGNTLLSMNGYRMVSSTSLYSEERPKKEDVTLTAVPYYAWGNRGENQMRVWMLGE